MIKNTFKNICDNLKLDISWEVLKTSLEQKISLSELSKKIQYAIEDAFEDEENWEEAVSNIIEKYNFSFTQAAYVWALAKNIKRKLL